MKLPHFQDMHKIGDHYIKIKLTSFTKTNIKYFLSYVESNFDFFPTKRGIKIEWSHFWREEIAGGDQEGVKGVNVIKYIVYMYEKVNIILSR